MKLWIIILIIFAILFTLLILSWWMILRKLFIKNNKYLTNKKFNNSEIKLVNYLGGKGNIVNVQAQQSTVRIKIKMLEIVNIKQIKNEFKFNNIFIGHNQILIIHTNNCGFDLAVKINNCMNK